MWTSLPHQRSIGTLNPSCASWTGIPSLNWGRGRKISSLCIRHFRKLKRNDNTRVAPHPFLVLQHKLSNIKKINLKRFCTFWTIPLESRYPYDDQTHGSSQPKELVLGISSSQLQVSGNEYHFSCNSSSTCSMITLCV